MEAVSGWRLGRQTSKGDRTNDWGLQVGLTTFGQARSLVGTARRAVRPHRLGRARSVRLTRVSRSPQGEPREGAMVITSLPSIQLGQHAVLTLPKKGISAKQLVVSGL